MATLLPVARAASLVFWWLLLCYARWTGRALAGPWGGRLAVAFLAVEPSFLGHAGLATTDVAVSACLLALVYHFRIGRERGWFHRLALPACWFALALLAKASALVYGPLCLLAVEAERLYRAGAFTPTPGSSRSAWFWHALAALRPLGRDLRWVLGGGLLGMMAYIGSDWRTEPSFIEWATALEPGGTRSFLLWTAEHLPIFSNGAEGLIQQVKHNIRGHGAYLLGVTDSRALWFYFPLLLTLTLTLSLLIGPTVLAATRPRTLLNWATTAALFVILVSPFFRVQLGIRLVLPIVTLVVVGFAAALANSWQSAGTIWGRRAWAGFAAVGLVWSAVEAGTSWPNGLCYINQAWGGTSQGYRYVSESNYDWGQGLKELSRWQRKQGLANLDIWYFGSDPAIRQPTFHVVALSSTPIESPEDVRALLQGRYLAVSTSLLYGMDRAGEQSLRERAAMLLRECRPVARTTTFLIYDLGE
jgi:hypothetical protein